MNFEGIRRERGRAGRKFVVMGQDSVRVRMVEGGPLTLDLEHSTVTIRLVGSGREETMTLQEFMKRADPNYLELPRPARRFDAATPAHPRHLAQRAQVGIRNPNQRR